MSDDADRAQALEERERQARIDAARQPPAEDPHSGADGFCGTCGDPIEAERLAVLPGARRCVVCQEARERGRRLYGG